MAKIERVKSPQTINLSSCLKKYSSLQEWGDIHSLFALHFPLKTDIMAAILNTIFDVIFRFITMGAPKGCPTGYKEFKTDTGGIEIVRCIATVSYGALKEEVPEGRIENTIYVKQNSDVEDQQIASGLNCPPGTYASEGLCHRGCPKYYERQEVLPSGSAKPDPTAKKQFRCIAQCNRDWGVLNWTNTGSPLWDQNGSPDPTTCYHAPPDWKVMSDPNNTLEVDAQLDIPFTLDFQASVREDNTSAQNLIGPDGNVVTGGKVYEKAGVYAARRRFLLGEAVPPMPCVFPNQITANGRCTKQCPFGWELVGDKCINTSQKCPAGITTEDPVTKAFCKPDIIPMPRGLSILGILAVLGGVGAVGGLAIKAIRAART
jgi:hypothetical protein